MNINTEYGVDVLPYLYSIQQLQYHEIKAFFAFLKLQFMKEEMELIDVVGDKLSIVDTENATTILLEIMSANIVALMATIVVMQYYFL
jgi:hypothetical protein